jgi:hypothetical protein
VTLDTCTTPITQLGTDDGETGEDGQLQHLGTEPASTEREYNMVNLYTVGGDAETAQPFVHEVQLLGPNGEVVRVRATINDGAMICTMSKTIFKQVRHRLGSWQPSKQTLHMANGTQVALEAKWMETIELEGIQTTGTFEVFDSTGGWSFLLGKPLLKSFQAHHDYERDEIQVSNAKKSTVLTNQIGNPYYTRQALQGTPLTADWKQGQKGASTAVHSLNEISGQEERKGKAQRHQESRETEAPAQGRQTDPFHPRRVEAVLRAITIGDDLSDSQ